MLTIAGKRLRTEVRKGQITEAAEKITLKYGSENVTIKKIAAEVGITDGAIYRHFESKSDIYSFLLNDMSENLLGEVENGLIAGGRIIDYLHNTFMNHVATIDESYAVSFQIISEVISLGDAKLNRQLKDIITDYLTYLKNLLTIGVRTGEIRGDIDLDATAMLFFSMVESVSKYWASNDYQFSLKEKAKPMWDIFYKAIVNTENTANPAKLPMK